MAWPSVRLDVDQPLGALGILVPFGVAGYIISSSSTALLLARLGAGWLLAASTALSAVGLAVYALAAAFWVVLLCVFIAGITSGAIDSALNAYAARRFGTRHITWMHACYCLGAMAGPAAFVLLLSSGVSWRWTYAGLAAAQGLLAVAFAVTASKWGHSVAPRERPAGFLPDARVLWPSLATYALQSGVEAGTGIWAYVYLTDGRGMPSEPAGLTVSAFWAMMLIGRLAIGQWADRLGIRRVVRLSMAGMLGGTILMAVPAPAWTASLGVAAMGLAAAPMFPLLTLTTKERVGTAHADRVIGIQFATSSAAGAIIAGATIGALTGALGPGVIGLFLTALAAALCLLHKRLWTTH